MWVLRGRRVCGWVQRNSELAVPTNGGSIFAMGNVMRQKQVINEILWQACSRECEMQNEQAPSLI